MKEIANTSNTALKDKSKGTLNRIDSLLKALKLCNEIQGNLLIRMMEIIINSNTVLR